MSNDFWPPTVPYTYKDSHWYNKGVPYGVRIDTMTTVPRAETTGTSLRLRSYDLLTGEIIEFEKVMHMMERFGFAKCSVNTARHTIFDHYIFEYSVDPYWTPEIIQQRCDQYRATHYTKER